MGMSFEQHLPVVCAVLQSAAKTPVVQFLLFFNLSFFLLIPFFFQPEDPDEEEIDHINTIYSSVFDAYICILQVPPISRIRNRYFRSLIFFFF